MENGIYAGHHVATALPQINRCRMEHIADQIVGVCESCSRFQEQEIVHGLEGVQSVMAYLGMIDAPLRTISEDRIFTKSTWVRAELGRGGFFFADVSLGDRVKKGDHLGRVIDPLTHEAFTSMSVPRPVLSDYGLFHLAWH